MSMTKEEIQDYLNYRDHAGREITVEIVRCFEPAISTMIEGIVRGYGSALREMKIEKSTVEKIEGMVTRTLTDLSLLFVLKRTAIMIEALELADKGSTEGMKAEEMEEKFMSLIKGHIERGEEKTKIVNIINLIPDDRRRNN
jgi:hypothetical protein